VLGNTILLKHAGNCPRSALALAELFHDAGVPEGVYTNVFVETRDIPHVIEHPAVQGVPLTGSDSAGAAVAREAIRLWSRARRPRHARVRQPQTDLLRAGRRADR
jgi:succinate-semialdehyde dehydrogenase / glutarate-semialdehyde dehydrogenase